jgi:hypothetical protein
MMVSVPAIAPPSPPETGASRKAMPSAGSSWRRCSRAAAGRMVLMSTATRPGQGVRARRDTVLAERHLLDVGRVRHHAVIIGIFRCRGFIAWDQPIMTGATNPPVGAWTVFLVFLRLGLTSFGGPIAHLGYFRDEFVTRRRWLGERSYADLVALCQFLPGPASSQVGMAIGLSRAGFPGALAAWAGFTPPLGDRPDPLRHRRCELGQRPARRCAARFEGRRRGGRRAGGMGHGVQSVH